MGVEETFNAMQMAVIRANVKDAEEATMDRYARILNPSLSDNLQLYKYETMDGLLHLAITLENVYKVRKKEHTTGPRSSNSQWKRDQGRGNQGGYGKQWKRLS